MYRHNPEQAHSDTESSTEIPDSLHGALKLIDNIDFHYGTLPEIAEKLLALGEEEANKHLPRFARGVQKIMGSLEETLASGQYENQHTFTAIERKLATEATRLTEYSYFVTVARESLGVSDNAVTYVSTNGHTAEEVQSVSNTTDTPQEDNPLDSADTDAQIDFSESAEFLTVRDTYSTTVQSLWSTIGKLPQQNREQWYAFVTASTEKTNALDNQPRKRMQMMQTETVKLTKNEKMLLRWLHARQEMKTQEERQDGMILIREGGGETTVSTQERQKSRVRQENQEGMILIQEEDVTASPREQREQRLRQIGKEVYVMTDDGLEKGQVMRGQDGKLWIGNHRETWYISYDSVRSDRNGNRCIWDPSELEGGSNVDRASHVPTNMQAEFIKRKFDFLEEHASLSKIEFNHLFDGSLEQANVGNCYLIASFVALQSCDHAETLIRTSIKQVPGGYKVKIPLGNKSSTEVFVSYSDIDAIQVTTKKAMRAVDAAMGWKILEAAYTLHFFGRDANGTINRKASQTGWSAEALIKLVHGSSKQDIPTKSRSQVVSFFESYSDGKRIACCSSRRRPGGGDTKKYSISGSSYQFHYNHAYCIRSVDQGMKKVTVVNPHDSSRKIELSYSQFIDAFYWIGYVQLDHRAMFQS